MDTTRPNDQQGVARIKLLINNLGLSQSAFAERIGIDASNFSKHLNGKLPLSDNLFNKIVVAVGASKKWLLTGDGSMWNSTGGCETAIPTVTIDTINPNNAEGAKIYDIDVTAGNIARERMFADEQIIGSINIPTVHPDCCIVRVSGDSMTPVIGNGDLIAIREIRNKNLIFWGHIYVVLLSMLFLKERVGFVVLFATLLGFGGIVLICDPHFNSIPMLNIILGILGGFMMALAFISLRNLKGYFDDNVVVLVFGITMSVVSLGILIVQASMQSWQAVWHTPSLSEWGIVIAMGIFGTFGQYFLTKAYMLAPAGIVAPIDYTRVVFGLIFGIMLGDALPHFGVGLGMVLVILSGIIIGLPNLLKDLRSIKRSKNV